MNDDAQHRTEAALPPAPRWRVSLRFILAAAFGTLVAVSVGSVLLMTVMANFANTFSLLNDRAIATVNGMEDAIRADTQRAENAVAAVAALAARGDAAADAIALEAILLAEPALDGLILMRGDVMEVRMRGEENAAAADPQRKAALAAAIRAGVAQLTGDAGWLEPQRVGPDLLHFHAARFRTATGEEGLSAAVVGRGAINRVLSRLGAEEGATAFVLVGDDQVIAHSRMPEVFADRDSGRIEDFPDPALQAFKRAVQGPEFRKAAARGIEVYDTGNQDDEAGYAYMLKDLPGYSSARYRLGAYFPLADVGMELRRAVGSLGVGLLGLIIAVIAAILLGKRISSPMKEIASAAEKLAAFELETIAPLRRSRVTELDQQAVALNHTRFAMQEFARYVPRKLVERLIRDGALRKTSESRRVTIMFTDIVGFTGLSERMDAAQTAEFLNAHFAEVCSIIETHGGTVDKFMGDGVMAYWGAPEDDPDQAAHAVAAAADIQRAIRRGNFLRRRNGQAPLHLRIGIHTGDAIVGNIGGGDRQNYTMVGDAVNVAQRLEQLGKEVMRPGDETIALATDDLVEAQGGGAKFLPAGTRILRGRERPVAIWMLAEGLDADKKIVEFPGAQSA